MAKTPDDDIDATVPKPVRPATQTILTSALIEELCDKLARGHYVLSAAAGVGVGRRSFYNWESKGKDARALATEGRAVPKAMLIYLEFVEAVELARDYGEFWLTEQVIESAAGKQAHLKKWQAFMTILERSRPDRWARWSRGKTPEDPQGGKPPLIDPAKLTDEELDQLEGLLAKAQQSDE